VTGVVECGESYVFPVTGQPVRTVTIDGEPWFVGRDVAGALGYTNPRKAVRDHVPAGHHRGNESFPLSDLGFQAQTVLIDEPGMYRLIMRASTALAERFQEWVTAEVLPAIRTTGNYSVRSVQPHVADLTTPEGVMVLAGLYQDAARRLVDATRRVAELEPRAEAWDSLGSGTDSWSLRDAAGILNQDWQIDTGQNRLLAYLKAQGMIDRNDIPYARYSRYLTGCPKEYTSPSGKTVTRRQIRITHDGLGYLRRRLAGPVQLRLLS
jgi:prophage antirepressor-like protein